MTRPSLVIALVFLGCLAASLTHAAEQTEDFKLEGWVPFGELDKALALAQEKDRGLVFLYIGRTPTKETAKLAEEWGRSQALNGLIRVVIYSTPKSKFEKVRTMVTDTNTQMPRLYFATPDMVVTGFVAPREPRRLQRVAGLAIGIDRWRAGVRDDLLKADALADQGRFGAALKLVNKIAEEDLGHTAAVMQTWLSLPDSPDDKSKAKPEAERKLADEEPSPKRLQGWYFPGLAEERTTLYQSKAATRLEDARKLAAEGKVAEARRLLAPLAGDGAGFPEQAEARKELATMGSTDEGTSAQEPDTQPPPEDAPAQDEAQEQPPAP